MSKIAVLEQLFYFKVPGINFVSWKHLLEQCWAFLKFEVQWSKVKVYTWPSMVKTTVLEPQLYSDVPDRYFCQSERLIGAVLSFSENLRSEGQRPTSPHDQIWAKLQFLIYTSIQCTRWQFFSIENIYRSSIENLRVKGQGHFMSKCKQKFSFGATCTLQRRFLKANVWLRHIESTCRRGIPSTFCCGILSSFYCKIFM